MELPFGLQGHAYPVANVHVYGPVSKTVIIICSNLLSKPNKIWTKFYQTLKSLDTNNSEVLLIWSHLKILDKYLSMSIARTPLISE